MTNAKRPHSEAPSVLVGEQRINKLLAAAGLGSRRQVDELITDGRVEIDGETVTQVGVKVDVEKSKISVDGEPLRRHRPMYFAVNKPAGVLCTNRDPEGRPRVIDLIPGNNRLFPVGRLDASSTGLILLTNDGELAQRLAHPKHSVPKQYFVVVAGQVEPDAMRRLQRGIYLAEGLARVDGAKIRKVRKGCTEIEITLSEGKNREIRRVLARLGHRVVTLRRTAIGPLKLAMLQEGGYRPLSPNEVASLYRSVEEIKRVKKADRKERDKRRATEMESLNTEPESLPTAIRKAPPKTREQEVNFDGNESKPKNKPKKKTVTKSRKWDSEPDDEVESLPSLAVNPYRLPDDDDNVIDPGYEDAILVRDTGPAFIEGTRRGKVLGYSQNEESEDDDPDSTGMGMMTFDDQDDDEDGDDVDDDDDSRGSFPGSFGDEDAESDEDFIDGVIASENEGFAPNQGPWSKSQKKSEKGTQRNSPEKLDKTSKGASRNKRSGVSPSPERRPTGNRKSSKETVENDRSYPPRRGRGRPATADREQPVAPVSKRSDSGGSELSDRPIAEQRRSTGGRSYGLTKSSRSDGGKSGGSGKKPAGGRSSSRPSGPGARSSGPGARSAGPGARSSGPGARSAGPGSRSSGPGSRSSGPGSRSSGPGSRSSGPGSRSAGPGGKRGGKPTGGPKGKQGGKGRR